MSYCHIISNWSMHSHVQRGNEKGGDLHFGNAGGGGSAAGGPGGMGAIGDIPGAGLGLGAEMGVDVCLVITCPL